MMSASDPEIKELTSSPTAIPALVSPLSKDLYQKYTAKWLPRILDLETKSKEGIEDMITQLETRLATISEQEAIVYQLLFGFGPTSKPNLGGHILDPEKINEAGLSAWIPTIVGGGSSVPLSKPLPSILKMIQLKSALEQKHPFLFDFTKSTLQVWDLAPGHSGSSGSLSSSTSLDHRMNLKKIYMHELKTKEEYLRDYLEDTRYKWIPYVESINLRLHFPTRLAHAHATSL
jgi:hypothetical protein